MPNDAATVNMFESTSSENAGFASYTASLITQGRHRFYTLSMPSEVLAETCVVDYRHEDPARGFQRRLDERRAKEIAQYIDSGLGTIPTSIVLSAQPEAQLEYRRKTRTLRFKKTPRAFLILDGQHRVFGFRMATTDLRVPVVIYNKLTRAEECGLFIDINTKQRPVPNELLLDIKRMAETEKDEEALLRDVFDRFAAEPNSPLLGLLSPSERQRGKISRVTFNAALKAIAESLTGGTVETIYGALSSYIHACVAGLRKRDAGENITNPTLFRALLLMFPTLAERVADRHGSQFTPEHFAEVLEPFFSRVRKSDLRQPGRLTELQDNFRKALRTGFSIGTVAAE